MFTGIIQAIGSIQSKTATSNGARFTIAAPGFTTRIQPADSVAVNGVCLTAEEVADGRFNATAVGETLHRTTLDRLAAGNRVNLETAATPSTALGGHIVQGHVDGIGQVASFRRAGQDWLLSVRLPEEAWRLTVPKGSIAVDGVSLTIIDCRPGFEVTMTIVPFTVEHTLIGEYRTGMSVNIETDIIGKYIKQFLNQ